jgi:hypothetical protein
MKIIYIEWNDALSVEGWVNKTEMIGELALIKSVGFLVKESDEIITICVNFDETNDNYSCIMNIPKKWIKTKKIIKTKLT